ncbi:MAG TPA: hypothetical protein ENN05_13095 [Deltaproteobacteria bacterium]|nr:hypothetical protein [Deltaproteobacteria bacterium]
MPKPELIDRHKCSGKDKEEKYKDLTSLDYWWGVRELAADFAIENYETESGEVPSEKQINEIAYIQLLHYTVEVKLSGAFYQMDNMERLFNTPLTPDCSLDLRVLEAKEAFDALHEDMYQSCCAIANQLYMLMNRLHYKPTKVDSRKPVAMSPSDLRYWLKINDHPDFKTLSRTLNDCDELLDMRHHATHYGAVPVYADKKTGVLFVQHNFRIGDLLTKYDIIKHINNKGKIINLVEASNPRIKMLCKKINRIYRYVYLNNIFESFMKNHALKIKDTYKPYWEQPGQLSP